MPLCVNVKNVAITATKVIVVSNETGERRIDVFGSNGNSCFTSADAHDGKGSGAHGENGENGNPGKSGVIN